MVTGYGMQQTSDGGYIVAGYTSPLGQVRRCLGFKARQQWRVLPGKRPTVGQMIALPTPSRKPKTGDTLWQEILPLLGQGIGDAWVLKLNAMEQWPGKKLTVPQGWIDLKRSSRPPTGAT